MFKRRLAVLGAVAVLAITGLAGSAMADEPPVPTAGSKVVCTTSDGKTIELTKAMPAELKDGKFMRTQPGGGAEPVEGGKVTAPAGKAMPALPSGDAVKLEKLPEPPKGAKGEMHIMRSDAGSPEEAKKALPAELAELAPEGVNKTIKITCVAPEKE
ncbi:hypothetical protein [Nonomuraea insulae]|uniref:Uncharacterized protein n=1 Tax=Nonomuraea insulae TaxID=1616787 RepID=A0ABW1CCB6_9ACTN